MVFIKNIGKKSSFFLMVSMHFVYGMENAIQPYLPYDCIEDIVCKAYVVPVMDFCRTIIMEPYDPHNVFLCDELIEKYKKIGSLTTVCKRAEKWLNDKWYKVNEEQRRCCLSLTQQDGDIFLQKAVAYQHKGCFFFAKTIGANVNAPIPVDDMCGLFLQGGTAIFIAVYHGDVAMVELLLKEGAMTNVVSYGFLTLERVAKAIMDSYVKTEERAPFKAILALLRKKKKR